MTPSQVDDLAKDGKVFEDFLEARPMVKNLKEQIQELEKTVDTMKSSEESLLAEQTGLEEELRDLARRQAEAQAYLEAKKRKVESVQNRFAPQIIGRMLEDKSRAEDQVFWV